MLAEPRAVLDSFFAAPTWEKRLAFCRQPGIYRDEMAAFYQTEKDGPESPISVTFTDSARFPGGKRSMMIFHVHFSDLPQGMPVGGYKESGYGRESTWDILKDYTITKSVIVNLRS